MDHGIFGVIWRLALLFVSVVVGFAIAELMTPRDDTDSPDQRSGMKVYRDHATGCQYVGGWSGTITPRLSHDGKPMCGEP